MDVPSKQTISALVVGGAQASFGGFALSVDFWSGLGLIAGMAILNAALYMLKPTARVVRRAWAQQMALRMHTNYQESDES
jgi:hypothetical protein